MYDHVQRLSAELNIIYKPCQFAKDVESKNYPAYAISSDSAPLYDGNCECSVRRVLDFEGIELGRFVNILHNKRSLDKLTECTEPTTSTDTICLSSKATTVSAVGSMHALPNIGKVTVSEQCINSKMNEEALKAVKSVGGKNYSSSARG